jgi:hypothetical protein
VPIEYVECVDWHRDGYAGPQPVMLRISCPVVGEGLEDLGELRRAQRVSKLGDPGFVSNATLLSCGIPANTQIPRSSPGLQNRRSKGPVSHIEGQERHKPRLTPLSRHLAAVF